MTSRSDKNQKHKNASQPPEHQHQEDNFEQEHDEISPDLLQKISQHDIPSLKPQNILRLQRLIGNQAVQRLLARKTTPSQQEVSETAPTLDKDGREPAFRSPALQLRRQLQTAPNARVLIQRAVKTWAGEWDTSKYDVVKDKKGKEIGLDIELKFHPEKQVNATQIGPVQTIISFDNGKISLPSGDEKTLTDRTIPVGEEGAGARVDRLAPADSDYGNPLYGTNEDSGNDTSLADATTMKNAQHGFHYKDDKGTVLEKDAILRDRPTRPARGANANQIFETTALAVGGEQEGTYYGSVQWGWQSDAAGAFTKLPLSLKSNDVPSDTFAAASELWNKSKTAKGNETINLPVVKGKYVNSAGVWLVTNPSKYMSTRTDKLGKNTRVEVTDKGEEQKFNQVSEDRYIWWKVTVVDGAAVGNVGWVMQHFLSDDKVKE